MDQHHLLLRVDHRRIGELDVAVLADRGDDLLRTRLVRIRRQHNLDRAVLAGTVGLRDLVVRNARRRPPWIRPRIDLSKRHREERNCQNAEDNNGNQEKGDRMRADNARPASPHPARNFTGGTSGWRIAIALAEDAHSKQREQGRKQRECRQDRRQHGERGGDAQHRHRLDTREEEASEGNRNRDSCHQHRASSRTECGRYRLLDRHPRAQLLAMAIDDKDGVIDADTEPNHRGEHRCD